MFYYIQPLSTQTLSVIPFQVHQVATVTKIEMNAGGQSRARSNGDTALFPDPGAGTEVTITIRYNYDSQSNTLGCKTCLRQFLFSVDGVPRACRHYGPRVNYGAQALSVTYTSDGTQRNIVTAVDLNYGCSESTMTPSNVIGYIDPDATYFPTEHPTKGPTANPTQITANPTKRPTSPTKAPSHSTNIPSLSPTTDPTSEPTEATTPPSTHPSRTPSGHPSHTPSGQPTRDPRNIDARVKETNEREETEEETESEDNEYTPWSDVVLVVLSVIILISIAGILLICYCFRIERRKRVQNNQTMVQQEVQQVVNKVANKVTNNDISSEDEDNDDLYVKYDTHDHNVEMKKKGDDDGGKIIEITKQYDNEGVANKDDYMKSTHEGVQGRTRKRFQTNTTQKIDVNNERHLNDISQDVQTLQTPKDIETEVCTDCGLMKKGKVFETSGLFYCNDCWKSYEYPTQNYIKKTTTGDDV